MRWSAILVLLLCATFTHAQAPQPAPTLEPQPAPLPKSETPQPTPAPSAESTSAELPDAPGMTSQPQDVVAVAQASFKTTGDGVKTCGIVNAMKVVYLDPTRVDRVRKPCTELIYPYQRFLTTNIAIPMTWQQKGYLALHDLSDPANFATIVGISAISIAADSHSAYGPGLKGFGKIAGVSLLQDATGQFFGVFAIPSIVHQDPRYYRMPNASIRRRIFYSVSRTFVSRHDDGTSMPNYSTLLTYPISAEIANIYVPGIHPDGPSTIARIATGIATDPANNLLTEFLPDVAKRIHVRVIFVQTLLNNMASGGATVGAP
ncbi:hypothetical protein [Granulicella sp. L60]|uniref:hypothetical protein n=1 Tax=Granulicella sp. L60 TaxID=1641866 RepID=UPI00131B909A|nr:hypothetical protein [Granulicella sp. L60]